MLIPEQLPEGPYGSPRNKHTPVINKSTPWKDGQRYYSAFNYNDKEFHQDTMRLEPGAHPPHDDSNRQHQNADAPEKN
ncbi:cytosolic protein [Litoribacterium kuwaitense]|uniref:cytosolic protein n=1 Tax=Litoribacterium kuwaitense TaxID=1398745 RepID=UPI001FE8EDE4|nr:cytosolic protein [Litoribacterium kuwaitense]